MKGPKLKLHRNFEQMNLPIRLESRMDGLFWETAGMRSWNSALPSSSFREHQTPVALTGFMLKTITRILLLDDDPDDCFIFHKALREVTKNVEVKCIEESIELKTAITSFKPQILFIDINMPGKSGIECIDELKSEEAFANLPVVVYSNSESSSTISGAYNHGATLYLTKTTTFDSLVLSLKQILELDWEHPDLLTNNFYVGGRYFPFEIK